jgi:hypothetical protein
MEANSYLKETPVRRISKFSLVALISIFLIMAISNDGTTITSSSIIHYVSVQTSDPFGSLSRHKCFKATPFAPSEICVFQNLYIVDNSLRYLTNDDRLYIEPVVHSGVPNFVSNNWLSSKPRVITQTELKLLENDGSSVSIDTPIFIYQRLNPYNIHHHLLDDMSTIYTLLTSFHNFTHSSDGQPLDVQLAFLDEADSISGPGGSTSSTLYDKGWEAISIHPAYLFSTFMRSISEPTMIRKLLVGSSGMCPHQRHCSVMLPPGALLSFKRHLNAYFGISSIFPLSPTALVIRRSKDRLMQNYDIVKDRLTSRGYNAQVVGPLSKYSLKEQLLLLSNASLYVFVAGAELGPILYAMPVGSSMCEIFPYLTAEDVPFWYGKPLGLGIALHEDAPTDPSNYRCAISKDQIGVHFTKLYRADVLDVNVTRLLESVTKVLDNFSQYESPKCAGV